MFGPKSIEDTLDRTTSLAVKQVQEGIIDALVSASARERIGMPQVDQRGYYDSDGNWRNYLRCGDALGSRKLGP